MSWTDERVELLKTMWAEGKSASQIAKELGSVTRNAVIGKVHRLGLSSRTTDAGSKAAEARKAASAASQPAPDPKNKADDAAPVGPDPVPPAAQAPAQADAAPAAPAQDDAPEAAAEVQTDPAPEPARATPQATTVTIIPGRRPIVPAGQPLPPQPSANEISPEALANVREVEKGARKLHLMDLTERTCKWPIGDPATEEFWFCGLPSVAGKPYCEAHVSVAFQPMQSRRDRRR